MALDLSHARYKGSCRDWDTIQFCHAKVGNPVLAHFFKLFKFFPLVSVDFSIHRVSGTELLWIPKSTVFSGMASFISVL